MKILLVDDNEVFRLSERELLKRAGHTVVTAPNAVTAMSILGVLQVIPPPPPDVIILDAQMPGMDGVELLREVRSRPEWRTLPVVFLTGDTADTRLPALSMSPYVELVYKPVDQETLIKVIRKVAGTRQYPALL